MRLAFRAMVYLSLLVIASMNAVWLNTFAKQGIFTPEEAKQMWFIIDLFGNLIIAMIFTEVTRAVTNSSIQRYGKDRQRYAVTAVIVFAIVAWLLVGAGSADLPPDLAKAWVRISVLLALIPALEVIQGAIFEDDLRRVLPPRVLEVVK